MVKDKFQIDIDYRVWQKIMALADVCEGEVGGFMLVREGKIIDLLVPEQEVSGASVDVTAQSVAKMIEEAEAEFGREVDDEIRGSWHSHGNLGAFSSGVDDDEFTKWLKNSSGCPFIYELIVAKSGSYKLFYEQKIPIPIRVECELVMDYPPNEFSDWAKTLKEAKVKSKTYSTAGGYYGGWSEDGAYYPFSWGGNKVDPKTIDHSVSLANGDTVITLKDGTVVTKYKSGGVSYDYGKHKKVKEHTEKKKKALEEIITGKLPFDPRKPKIGDEDTLFKILNIFEDGAVRVLNKKANKEFTSKINPLLRHLRLPELLTGKKGESTNVIEVGEGEAGAASTSGGSGLSHLASMIERHVIKEHDKEVVEEIKARLVEEDRVRVSGNAGN